MMLIGIVVLVLILLILLGFGIYLLLSRRRQREKAQLLSHYKDKLAQWEREGYDVSEFKRKWPEASLEPSKEKRRSAIQILAAALGVVSIGALAGWAIYSTTLHDGSGPTPTPMPTAALTPTPTLAPTPIPLPTVAPTPTSATTTTIRFNVLTGLGQSGIARVAGYIQSGMNVNGSFTVTQGGSRDIIFYIKGPTDSIIWGSSSGPRTSDYGSFSFTATLSGTYTLVFDNTFSLFADKHITLQITGGVPWSLIEGALE
jgi:hypothetical protein